MTSTSSYLFGKHTVLAALKNPKRPITMLYVTSKIASRWNSAWGPLESVPHQVISLKEMDDMFPSRVVHQGFVLEVRSEKDLSLEGILENFSESGIIVVLDQVTDPHNVGAILRSCAVFGVQALIVTERHSASMDGIVAKTASGALEYVPLIQVGNLKNILEILKKHSFWIYGLDERGSSSLNKTKFSGRIGLVFGAEGKGLRVLTKETCDVLVSLSTPTAFSTLNVSNMVAVTLYAVSQQLAS